MAHVTVLGCGLVGSTLALDLSRDPSIEVVVADADRAAVERTVTLCSHHATAAPEPMVADLSERDEVIKLVAGADCVIGALPSKLGLATLQTMIAARTPYVDISFMAEDALGLDHDAKRAGVTTVVDCGVAPGLSNMIAAACVADLESCESLAIYVGGIPRHPRWPFLYKAAFAPADVIEEYTRPARLVEDSRIITREALSEIETLQFDPSRFAGISALEAFNTDGLRSLIETLEIPNMKEKTLRHPGHAELMRAFRETGLFEEREIQVGKVRIRPRDLTATLLFPKWSYEAGESDLTIMRIIAESANGARLVWELFDERDPATGCSSMSRTTGFPATFICREILAGRISQPGVLPPERLVMRDRELLGRLVAELTSRGVEINRFDS